jgi:cyclohexa-1,5-dienecarbonyl-CoA hydratase
MLEGVESWLAKTILPKSASSLSHAVRAARWQFNQTIREGLGELERFYVDELMETHDANEGIASFMEKRKPDWQNQ